MKKTMIAAIVLLLVTGICFAQGEQVPVVAIDPLQTKGGLISPEDEEALTGLLMGALFNTGGITLVGQDTDGLERQSRTQRGPWSSSNATIRMGEVTNPDFLIEWKLDNYRNQVWLSGTVFTLPDHLQKGTATTERMEKEKALDAAPDYIDKFAADLIASMGIGSQRSYKIAFSVTEDQKTARLSASEDTALSQALQQGLQNNGITVPEDAIFNITVALRKSGTPSYLYCDVSVAFMRNGKVVHRSQTGHGGSFLKDNRADAIQYAARFLQEGREPPKTDDRGRPLKSSGKSFYQDIAPILGGVK